MRTSAAAALAFAGGVLCGVLVAPRKGEPARARAGGEEAAEARRLAAAVETLRRENRGLREALEREDAASAEAAPASPGEARDGGGVPAPSPARPRKGPALAFPAHEAALAKGDWSAAGASLARLMPLLAEAAEVAHGRRPMRAALWGDIVAALGPVYTLAVEVELAGVPWSSPSVLVNLVHATLEEAGRPLDERQAAALHAVATRFVEEEARRLAGYREATPAFRRRLELVRAGDRLFAELEPHLTVDQRAVLWPPGVRGVVALDVFSGSGNWDEHIERLPHRGAEDLPDRAFELLAREGGLRADLAPLLRPWLVDWAGGLPPAVVASAPSGPAAGDVKMERSDLVLLVAERQLALLEALLASAPLEPGERERLRALDRVYVPGLRAGG